LSRIGKDMLDSSSKGGLTALKNAVRNSHNLKAVIVQ